MSAAVRRWGAMAAVAVAAGLAGCGGGEVWVDTGPAVVVPAIAPLDLVLTRTGPATVQLDWSYDALAARYVVARDGYVLGQFAATTLVDASVVPGYRYCYQVSGLDAYGREVSRSGFGCLSVL